MDTRTLSPSLSSSNDQYSSHNQNNNQPTQQTLASQKLVNNSALDLLIIEIVPMVQNLVTDLGSETDNNEDDVYYRIEGYGYRVGRGLAEIFTRDRARFTEKQTELDIMKFICKELWPILYKKQIDNLKTNHRGTFVLIDNNFKYCQRMATNEGTAETIKRATPYLWFPVGMLRGVLAALGTDNARVSFDTQQLPSISFNIQTKGGE